MCALFGWLDYKRIVPYKTLKKLTQALANAAEERGTDASGISYIKDGKVIEPDVGVQIRSISLWHIEEGDRV